VTDLVASVIPMVYAQTRQALHAADVRGQMFVELMGAAYRFDPQRIGPERWPGLYPFCAGSLTGLDSSAERG
jgi:hypothetical protein